MNPTKQNLVLFFEENELPYVINKNLVRIYANRCVIDEDAQFEVIGVYWLQNVTKSMYELNDPLYKAHSKQRTSKEAYDRETISEALEEAYAHETASVDTHFIIGSCFYSNRIFRTASENRLDKLLEWMQDELELSDMKTINISLLGGYRCGLIMKKMVQGVLASIDPRDDRIFTSSVHEDFEFAIHHIRRGRRSQQTPYLFLQQKLPPYQFDLIKARNEHFLQTFISSNGALGPFRERFSPEVPPDDLKECSDPELKVRFINCLCFRLSYCLK